VPIHHDIARGQNQEEHFWHFYCDRYPERCTNKALWPHKEFRVPVGWILVDARTVGESPKDLPSQGFPWQSSAQASFARIREMFHWIPVGGPGIQPSPGGHGVGTGGVPSLILCDATGGLTSLTIGNTSILSTSGSAATAFADTKSPVTPNPLIMM
jgi:hypothetical protein